MTARLGPPLPPQWESGMRGVMGTDRRLQCLQERAGSRERAAKSKERTARTLRELQRCKQVCSLFA